jgi:opacity protein-like surface antigen
MIRFRVASLLLLGLTLASWTSARAEWVVVPPRTGQVGLGVQGQYGGMLDTGGIGSQFETGPGLAVRLRYRMRYERGMGLSFESQRFDVRQVSLADTAANHMNAYTYGFDVYQMFGTRTRTTKWVSVGVGLAEFRRVLNDKEIDFSNNSDGVYVSAATGIERFVWQSWAIDLSGKYLTVFQDGKANHDFQASLGLIVYATY